TPTHVIIAKIVHPSLSLKLRVMKPGACTMSAPAPQRAQLGHARQWPQHGTARLAGLAQLLQQHLAKRRQIQPSVDLALAGDADQPGLLARDEDERIALHGQSERGSMTRPHP